jgi:hypothetical protein
MWFSFYKIRISFTFIEWVKGQPEDPDEKFLSRTFRQDWTSQCFIICLGLSVGSEFFAISSFWPDSAVSSVLSVTFIVDFLLMEWLTIRYSKEAISAIWDFFDSVLNFININIALSYSLADLPLWEFMALWPVTAFFAIAITLVTLQCETVWKSRWCDARVVPTWLLSLLAIINAGLAFCDPSLVSIVPVISTLFLVVGFHHFKNQIEKVVSQLINEVQNPTLMRPESGCPEGRQQVAQITGVPVYEEEEEINSEREPSILSDRDEQKLETELGIKSYKSILETKRQCLEMTPRGSSAATSSQSTSSNVDNP